MELLNGVAGYVRSIPNSQNKLGAMRGDLLPLDEFPGVAGNLSGNEAEFVPVDPDVPALPNPEPDLTQILRAIEYNTRRSENVNEHVRPFFETIVQTEAGEKTFRIPESAKHIFISNPPVSGRALSVYYGAGTALFLASVAVGTALTLELPMATEAITVAYASGNVGDRFAIVFSVKGFVITKS